MADTPQPLLSLSQDQREVLLALGTYDGEPCPYVRTVARNVGLPVEQVRQIIRHFDSLGLVTYGPIHDIDDGRPLSSTWWLTDRGVALRQQEQTRAL